MSRHPVSVAATACRRKAHRDDERGDTLLEVLMTLIVLSIAVVALIITFETGISASVDHKNLAANDVVLRQVEEQAFNQIEQRSSGALYKSCATNAAGGPYSGITYNNLPSGYVVTMNPITYWDTTVSPATFDGTCAPNSPQLISLTLTAPSGQGSATTTFVVDNLGAGSTSGLSITSCSLTPPPATPTACSAVQGTSNLTVYLNGTGFANDATASFAGASAITVNSTTFVTSTLLDLNVSIAATPVITSSVMDTVTVTNHALGTSLTSGPIFTVLPVGVTTGMHISAMSKSPLLGFITWWYVVEVTVEDASNRPVRHATVSGTWTPSAPLGSDPGLPITLSSCTTDGSGSCYVLYNLFGFPQNPGTATYNVTGVTAAGQTYAGVGSDTPDPPTITVNGSEQ